jgi:putative flavoprotein involved in K+ transport
MTPTPTAPGAAPLDAIVIGAGQAGLALGHHLARRDADFLLLDAGPEIGSSWRSRWDSLRLFTPAQYDSLPGLPFPAPADTHPGKDDVADYLAAYAAHFALPVRLDSPVLRLHHDGDGSFAVTTPTGTLRAGQVVVATGPFQTPHVPALAQQLDPLVPQLHSAGYRNPPSCPPVPGSWSSARPTPACRSPPSSPSGAPSPSRSGPGRWSCPSASPAATCSPG